MAALVLVLGALGGTSVPARAAEERSPWVIQLGFAAYNFGRTASQPTGEKSFFGPTEPFLIGATWRSPYSNGWAFEPTVTLGLIGRGAGDSAGRWRTFGFLFPFVTPGSFAFSMGPGVIFSIFTGAGGTSVLNNGNTTTTFYLPAGTTVTTNVVLSTGFVAWFSDTLRMDMNLLYFGLLSSRRAVGMLLEVGYAI
ncbi:MAG: hypothetical protein AB7P04_00840 [Bacteriovoracia bacterium]